MRRLVLTFLLATMIHLPAQAQDILHPIRLYSAVGHKVPVVLSMRGRVEVPKGGFGLVLLDGAGVVMDSYEGLAPGTFDLGEVLPKIWSLKNAARAQVIVDGVAVGTPVVVQPMHTPPKVRTVQDLRPEGNTKYTRVIGFDDTAIDPDDQDMLEKMKSAEDWEPREPAVNSGVRVYLDRDILLRTEFGDIRIALASGVRTEYGVELPSSQRRWLLRRNHLPPDCSPGQGRSPLRHPGRRSLGEWRRLRRLGPAHGAQPTATCIRSHLHGAFGQSTFCR